MAAKTEPEKLFCLYHKTEGCNCIHPVTDAAKVQDRIDNQLKIWRIRYKHSSEAERAKILEKVKKLKEKHNVAATNDG